MINDSLFTRSYTSQMVQDFFHQQCVYWFQGGNFLRKKIINAHSQQPLVEVTDLFGMISMWSKNMSNPTVTSWLLKTNPIASIPWTMQKCFLQTTNMFPLCLYIPKCMKIISHDHWFWLMFLNKTPMDQQNKTNNKKRHRNGFVPWIYPGVNCNAITADQPTPA